MSLNGQENPRGTKQIPHGTWVLPGPCLSADKAYSGANISSSGNRVTFQPFPHTSTPNPLQGLHRVA
ncbi:hypothetical protein CgunFtcFv8_025131 [Champsocephalus gunnari]|nr:hypothetical protein CgunFtcFv8_025131 [Champsocephalus gunnari]